MKTILLAAALALCVTAAANAAELPKELIGTWCLEHSAPRSIEIYFPSPDGGAGCKGSVPLVIEPDGYVFPESAIWRFNKITREYSPQAIAIAKVEARCVWGSGPPR